jgi:hypothetical protein
MFQVPSDNLCLKRRPVAPGFAPLYHGDSRSRAVAAVLSGEVLSKGLLSVTTVPS